MNKIYTRVLGIFLIITFLLTASNANAFSVQGFSGFPSSFFQSFITKLKNKPTPTSVPVEVPKEYASLYKKLDQKLNAFDKNVSAKWNGVKHPVDFSAGLFTANSNNGEALLTKENYEATIMIIDRLQSLGVKGVAVELNFPLLTPGFLEEQKRQDYLNFYKKIAQEVKNRGLKLSIESVTIFPNFSALPVSPYYKTLSFEQYKQARLETLKVIVSELKPDYLTVGNEPDTEAANSGQKQLKNVNKYVDMINFFVRELKKSGIQDIKLGAGLGTWLKNYQTFTKKLAKDTNLDFIDIHIYPVDGDFLDRALTISDIAKKYGKGLGLHEAWMYKWQEREGLKGGGIAASASIYARDVYSFWQPLDKKFLGDLVKLAHYKQFDYISPFWSNYFFAYFEYKDIKNTPESKLLNEALKAGIANAQAGKITETGLFYKELIGGGTTIPTPGPTFIPTPVPTLIPTPTPKPTPTSIDWLGTDGNIFLDSSGRAVILRGFVTATHNDSEKKDEVTYTSADYQRMKTSGANYQSIRIYVGWIGGWPGYEAAPGYLDKLDQMISRAKQEGIYSEFKLTLYDLPGMLRRDQTQKHATWGAFWRNAEGEQEALIAGWKKIWEHYKDEPAIIGYDLLNEPEKGDLSVSADEFTKNYLIPFDRKIIDEFRKIDKKHFALMQPGFGGIDAKTGDIAFYPLTISVERPIVYAPHVYITFPLRPSFTYSPERYQALVDRYVSEAKLQNAPLLIGEMGEFWLSSDDGNGSKETAFRAAEDTQIDLFDQKLVSFSRPIYTNDRSIAVAHNILKGKAESISESEERTWITDTMARPYPQRTAGILKSMTFDIDKKSFSLVYRADSSLGTTEVFIPVGRHYKDGFTVKHSGGITLNYDPVSHSLKVASNGGNIDAERISWDETNQVLRIQEWVKGSDVTITVTK